MQFLAGVGGFNPVSATGGNTVDTYTSGGVTYKYHKFTSTGTFTVSDAGSTGAVEYLVVAGSGGAAPRPGVRDGGADDGGSGT